MICALPMLSNCVVAVISTCMYSKWGWMTEAKCLFFDNTEGNMWLTFTEKWGGIVCKLYLPGSCDSEGAFCVLSVGRPLCFSAHPFGLCIKLSSAVLDDQHQTDPFVPAFKWNKYAWMQTRKEKCFHQMLRDLTDSFQSYMSIFSPLWIFSKVWQMRGTVEGDTVPRAFASGTAVGWCQMLASALIM